MLDDDALLAALDPECVPALLRIPPLECSDDPVEMRSTSHAVADCVPRPGPPPGVTVDVIDAAGALPPLRVFRPEQPRRPEAAILWLHGGGLIAGAARYDDPICAGMAADHGCAVVSVEYRLAPETPYPGALEDCLAAAHWAVGRCTAGRAGGLLVAGTSAGGGLAVALALLARDRGIGSYAGLVLAYPMLDDRSDSASMRRVTARRTWQRQANMVGWRSYLGDLDDVPIYAAPGRAAVDQLRGLPPVHLDVGTLDAFLDEDVDFARRLALADVAVDLVVTPQAAHGSEYMNPRAPTSRLILAARRAATERMLTSSRRS